MSNFLHLQWKWQNSSKLSYKKSLWKIKLSKKNNVSKRVIFLLIWVSDHNGIRDVDIKGKVVDYLLEIVVNKKRNKNKCNLKD